MSALTQLALVLNRGWTPIGVASVRDALVLLVKGSAQAVHPGTYRAHDFESWVAEVPAGANHVRTPSLLIPVPEVILLLKFDRSPAARAVYSKRSVYRRDRFTCQYCGTQGGPEKLTVDHVIPKARGGRSTWDNCVLACEPCNSRKADRTPEQAGMALRRRPRVPQWSPLAGVHPSRVRSSWGQFVAAS